MSTVQYIYYTQVSDEHTGSDVNSDVSTIYKAYRADGRITQDVEYSTPNANGVITNTLTFQDQATYNTWYAEIDAIDTTPPSGVSYIGAPVEPS